MDDLSHAIAFPSKECDAEDAAVEQFMKTRLQQLSTVDVICSETQRCSLLL